MAVWSDPEIKEENKILFKVLLVRIMLTCDTIWSGALVAVHWKPFNLNN